MDLPQDKNNNTSQTVFISIQRLHVIFNVQHSGHDDAEDCAAMYDGQVKVTKVYTLFVSYQGQTILCIYIYIYIYYC